MLQYIRHLPVYPNSEITESKAHIYSDRIECRPDMVEHVKEMIDYFLNNEENNK